AARAGRRRSDRLRSGSSRHRGGRPLGARALHQARVKILQLAAETPVPPTSGGRRRVLHLARQLATAADVQLLALGAAEADTEPFSLRGVPPDGGPGGAPAGAR